MPLNWEELGFETEIERESILRVFLAESLEHLTDMEEALVILETRPEDEETLQTIFRAAHTIKGSAGCLGFRGVTEFAHVLEDFLDRLRNRSITVTSPLITLLLRAVDVLRQLVPDAVNGLEEIKPWQMTVLRRLVQSASLGAAESELVEETDGESHAQASGQDWMTSVRTLRVEIDKLDLMLNLTGEIAIAQGRLRQMLERQQGEAANEILETHMSVDHLYMDLQELVMRARMEPVGPTFRQYIRTVRDLSISQGKMARLSIEGEDVEVDTKVVEMLKDPLTHMIRNALDHGIEKPAIRIANGKPECGTIILRARHDAGFIEIQLQDDGAGLDRDRILARARSRGLISKQEEPNDQQIHSLLFEPGFSTAESVTELSGRGVGLDVVRRNIEALRGSVTIDSREGEGATLIIRLPLTLAIIDGFSVGVGDETYVVPMDSVVECLELPVDQRHHSDGSGVLNLRGEVLPYLRLRELFSPGESTPGRENVLVVQHGKGRAGIVVDELHGKQQTVIKPLGRLFEHLPGICGSAILGDGKVALILDVPTVLEKAIEGSAATRVSTRSRRRRTLRKQHRADLPPSLKASDTTGIINGN